MKINLKRHSFLFISDYIEQNNPAVHIFQLKLSNYIKQKKLIYLSDGASIDGFVLHGIGGMLVMVSWIRQSELSQKQVCSKLTNSLNSVNNI